MTGLPWLNKEAFHVAATDLRRRGFDVISPAEMDDNGASWAQIIGQEVVIVADRVDAVAVLPGWQRSRGARLETFVAFICHKTILHYPSMRRVSRRSLVRAWLGSP